MLCYAHKKQFIKNDSNIICICNTYLKINQTHSDFLKDNEKIAININDIFKIEKEEKDYYLVYNIKITQKYSKILQKNNKITMSINDTSKIDVNLVYFNRWRNFGDELSAFITYSLINKNIYNLVYNQKNIDINIISIGSYMHKAKNNYFIFGSGIRTIEYNIDDINEHDYKNLNVCAVRGPLTKKYLENKNIYVRNVFGDPGLLISKFYIPEKNVSIKNKIGLIPHKTNYKMYLEKYDKELYYLINPMDDWKNVINSIYSCKSIISSSLHGLICSDAYNIPNLWLDEYALEEGDFKFKDYFQSQNRNYIKINNLEEFNENMLYKNGNKINLELLMEQFPFR